MNLKIIVWSNQGRSLVGLDFGACKIISFPQILLPYLALFGVTLPHTGIAHINCIVNAVLSFFEAPENLPAATIFLSDP